ncbi:transmembrane adaptor Erv26-domain-containing protein [Abortiporus biennis]|nr:transmembrane adaptor Erv26-domain-containing protein [Abortiporus biennis]
MSLLHYMSYAGAAAAFVFITLSLELIEEHSRSAKVVGERGIYAIILIHIALYFYDSLPLRHVLFSIVCHIVYLQNFTASWPIISLSSLGFIASCIMVVIDHFIWFFHFAHLTQEARHKSRMAFNGRPRTQVDAPGFAEIATFFGICVWLAPLFLFLSLSANDNTLPVKSSGRESVPNSPVVVSSPIMTRPKGSLFKSLFDTFPRIRSKARRESLPFQLRMVLEEFHLCKVYPIQHLLGRQWIPQDLPDLHIF